MKKRDAKATGSHFLLSCCCCSTVPSPFLLASHMIRTWFSFPKCVNSVIVAPLISVCFQKSLFVIWRPLPVCVFFQNVLLVRFLHHSRFPAKSVHHVTFCWLKYHLKNQSIEEMRKLINEISNGAHTDFNQEDLEYFAKHFTGTLVRYIQSFFSEDVANVT